VVGDESVPAADVLAAILAAGGDLQEDARLFDVYRGEPIPAGKKSRPTRCQPRADRTLEDKEDAKSRADREGGGRRQGATLRA